MREKPASAESAQGYEYKVARASFLGSNFFLPQAKTDILDKGSAACQGSAAVASSSELAMDAGEFISVELAQSTAK